MGDDEFLSIVREETMRDVQEKLHRHTATVMVGDAPVTLDEAGWLDVLHQVREQFHWSAMVMTWPDLERMLKQYVGFETDDEEQRYREFFLQGVAQIDDWKDPGDTVWSPATLLAHVLMRMRYFDSPEEMIRFLTHVMEADNELIGNGADDEDDEEED